MKRKIACISLALIGFVFFFSGSAWAGRDHRPGHHYDQRHAHHGGYVLKQPGWRYGTRHHGRHFYRGPWHRGRHLRPAQRPIEKHVYHHYENDANAYRDDQYQVEGSVADPFFSFSFGISGAR